MLRLGLLVVLLATLLPLANAQGDLYNLPQAPRYAPKPTVPPELRKYFELDGHARELVDSLLGPRPGGLFPEKTFEIGNPTYEEAGNQPVHVPSTLEKTLENFFTAPENPGQALPPGFNGGGFSLLNNQKSLASFGNGVRRAPQKTEDEVEGSGEGPKSSIAGIPKVIPKFPKNPFTSKLLESPRPAPAVITGSEPVVPVIKAPEVPEGGFLPADIRRSPQSVSEVAQSIDEPTTSQAKADEYGGLTEQTSGSSSSGGLIGTIFNLIGLGNKKAEEAKRRNATGEAPPKEEEKNAFGRSISNLLGGPNSPIPGKSTLANALYKALTSGSVAGNETLADNNGTIVLSPAQSAAIGENLEMVKNLIIQPSSPLCTSKPEPVNFNLDSFMGQWYQVVYSPPMSSGPCSMVAYKKLSNINSGGVGSIFEIFEYSTDGTPYGKPKITSGYAIIKSEGELIFRTTSNQDDVTVHVLHLGPTNRLGEYEYVVMSTNCNFPLYVFARDPITYKQKYEAEVNRYLETKNLVNGFSRLLNIVAPVDNSMCTFPPSLFNIAG